MVIASSETRLVPSEVLACAPVLFQNAAQNVVLL
jgi:hypothetical protein